MFSNPSLSEELWKNCEKKISDSESRYGMSFQLYYLKAGLAVLNTLTHPKLKPNCNKKKI